MKITPLALPGLLSFEPVVHADSRGYLFESYSEAAFWAALAENPHRPTPRFVQENQSSSHRGVLRGLHFQAAPHAQGKLMRVLSGCIWDVVVDLRPESPTFAQSLGLELSAENRLQLWIPEGFAHGFLTLSETAEILYKITAPYAPQAARVLAWDDPQLNITWPLEKAGVSSPMLSAADQAGTSWADFLGA